MDRSGRPTGMAAGCELIEQAVLCELILLVVREGEGDLCLLEVNPGSDVKRAVSSWGRSWLTEKGSDADAG